ncbi:MAG: DUF1501 domain-containing protein [Pirellulaceae bacterium]|nr:DUF1501 domain-containing protein [Pirellulaceae bacterium]
MWTLRGKAVRDCRGVSRRDFLCAGALGIGGLTLADLLRLEADAGITTSKRAVINIHLDGGPPPMDMIDMKPQAPAEVRGELSPISTTVPGIHICELMPRIATMVDQFALIRSLVGSAGRHDAFQCQSGFSFKDLESIGGRPTMGSVIAKLRGTAKDSAPPYVDLMQGRPLVRNSARPGFLGPAYGPFRPDISAMFARPLEDGMKKELAAKGANHATSLKLNDMLSNVRLDDRAGLLIALDRVRREVDATGMMDAMDRFTQQAAGILLSGRFADAMDLSKEDPRTLARYTSPTPKVSKFATADDEFSMRKLLLARRLVEEGVRCVSVSFSDFDTHSSNFDRMRHMLPILDRGLHALVSDLAERGRLQDVSIVAWGEFGRSPKINAKAGRDHWPRVAMAMLAGGGMRGGQVIGATDRTASAAVARPVTYQDVFATLYRNLGIAADKTTIVDPTGRPRYLVSSGEPLAELG